MKMPYPKRLPKEVALRLLSEGRIEYNPECGHATWLEEFMMFSLTENRCWQVLWDNLFRGNQPIPQERILAACRCKSIYLSYLFKRHAAWRRIIVGDGKGNFWLHVPESIIR